MKNDRMHPPNHAIADLVIAAHVIADERIFTASDLRAVPVHDTGEPLLRRAMAQAGFAPFNGEWWHFSYGDREWAAVWNAPFALYTHLPEPE